MDWTAIFKAIADKGTLFVDLAWEALNTALIVTTMGLGVSVVAWFGVEWFMKPDAREATKKQAALILGIVLCFIAHVTDILAFGVGPAGWGRALAAAIFGGLLAGPLVHRFVKRFFPGLTNSTVTVPQGGPDGR